MKVDHTQAEMDPAGVDEFEALGDRAAGDRIDRSKERYVKGVSREEREIISCVMICDDDETIKSRGKQTVHPAKHTPSPCCGGRLLPFGSVHKVASHA